MSYSRSVLLTWLAICFLLASAIAQNTDTRVGRLEFENGFPTDATIDSLYDRIDFQRACQGYLWALPLVEMAEWQHQTRTTLGATDFDFGAYLTFSEKIGILTANATTPYYIAFPDLTQTGPLVIVEPAGFTAGGILDMWQRPLVDTGQIGPFRGKGGKYLMLAPDHPEMDIAGYHVIRSRNNSVMVAFRVLDPDPARHKAIASKLHMYPYAKRDNPGKTRLIRPDRKWTAMQPRGIGYWKRLADIVAHEPVHERDRVMMGMLASIGIEKGRPFTPDVRLTGLLEEASHVGEAMARANSYAKRLTGSKVWPDRRWEMSLLLKDTTQEVPSRTQVDERASWFYEAIGVTEGMLGKTVNAGQVYLESQKDSQGRWLDGGKNYRLRVPPNAPVKQFWSFTVYDNTTRCLVDTGRSPDRSSRMDLQKNDDGSVDLYFGPTAPAGKEKNWVQTIPGKGWFTYFRLYAPTQPFFDRTWKLEDIEQIELPRTAPAKGDLPDWQYYGYKIAHHMGAVVKHIDKFGFNTFDHPRMADYRSFVITPALDHFYSKAVADVRWGPIIIDTPAKDDRYSSLEVFDMEHHATYDKLLDKGGERFVLIHEDYDGKLPRGTVIRTKSNFPFVFMRTQSFAFNDDQLADAIRRRALIHGLSEAVNLPNPKDAQALVRWTVANSKPYPQTQALMAKAATSYTSATHAATFESIKAFMASGGLTGNVGMFEPVDHPAGGSHKVRAAGCFLGHLGFPVHHAYYQQVPIYPNGKQLSGKHGPFVVKVPFDPGVALFWSVTRYDANTFLPLDPADIGKQDVQAFNAFSLKPDQDGMVTITFSKTDPKDGSYWMPVIDNPYYLIFRYYGPTPKLNGKTALDIVYGGTPFAKRFKPVVFN